MEAHYKKIFGIIGSVADVLFSLLGPIMLLAMLISLGLAIGTIIIQNVRYRAEKY